MFHSQLDIQMVAIIYCSLGVEGMCTTAGASHLTTTAGEPPITVAVVVRCDATAVVRCDATSCSC